MPDTEEVRKQTKSKKLGKEPKMAYKKPELVAKSEAKQSFVAGCPMHTVSGSWCAKVNGPKCQTTQVK